MLYLVISYVIGTLMTAWFIGKWYGHDLRMANSGNLGARNAGRTLGKGAFIVTATGDVLKGVSVVLLGRYVGLSELMVAVGVLAVVCGHLYPFWLKGRGGKGVATLLGALLIFSWQATLIFLGAFFVVWLMKRSATISLVIALIVSSIAVFYWQRDGALFMSAASVLVIWKHRENILERVK